jgi:hypothetical protein
MTTDPTVPARAGLYAALAQLQGEYTATTTLADALALMPGYGLSCFVRTAGDEVEIRLCHSSGGDLAMFIDLSVSPKLCLSGLIGLRSVVFPPAPEPAPVAPPAPEPAPAPEPEPVAPSAPGPDAIEAAAESLAAATAGQVIPEPTTEPDPETPLTDEQKASAVEMVKQMTAEQRKAFTIAFRDAFNVPREARAVAPYILQLKHLHFVDRFTVEAAGGVAP